jgi:hypothetical protein
MRKFTYTSICFLSLMIVFSSCEKQEFVADQGTPVFMAEVPFVNEEKFEVIAGDELFYMFASHQELENSVVHSGLFGKEEICEEDCVENFAIKIVNKQSVQESLTAGNYEFYSLPKEGFKHNFEMQSSDEEALSWTTWRVQGQNHIGLPSISFNSNNDSAPQEGIELLYDVPGQFIVQFERPISPKSVDCSLTFNIKRIVNEGIFLELSTTSPFTFVTWSTGETNKKIKIDFTSQSYSANIFDASGCQTKVIVHFKTKNILKDYSLTLNQESYMFSTPDNSDRSVIIEYTDKEGVFYTTSVLGQILPFEFNIHSVEDYETNELGQPTWKIDSSFDCILFGDNGTTKRIVDGKAVFAVGY